MRPLDAANCVGIARHKGGRDGIKPNGRREIHGLVSQRMLKPAPAWPVGNVYRIGQR